MSLPASKRQTATAIVFRSLFANQSAQTFLVFGTLNPPQIAPFSFTTVLGTFNNFTQFVSNSPTLNSLNLIYGNLYLQYNLITQQPLVGDAGLDAAITSALASLVSMNTLVQAFTASTINGASNQADLKTLQTLVSNLVAALTAASAANDDE